MTPREAIEAADLAEAETAYRNQLGREMYQAGHADGYRAGYRQADADQAARWNQTARAASTAPPTPNSRNGGGDQADAPTSPTRAPATSPAAAPSPSPARDRNGGRHMSMAHPEFPDDSDVMVRYPAPGMTASTPREAWPWMPGVIENQCGADEWMVTVYAREVAQLEDGSPPQRAPLAKTCGSRSASATPPNYAAPPKWRRPHERHQPRRDGEGSTPGRPGDSSRQAQTLSPEREPIPYTLTARAEAVLASWDRYQQAEREAEAGQ